MSGNRRQRIVLTNVPDASLHSGASLVEMPNSGWRQRQVCVPGSIGVMLHDKPGRLWVALLDGPTRHNAAPSVWPIVGMVLKFRDLPTRIHLFIAQRPSSRFSEGIMRETTAYWAVGRVSSKSKTGP